jgi:hypothetical protein
MEVTITQVELRKIFNGVYDKAVMRNHGFLFGLRWVIFGTVHHLY